jgi:YesN/AraC family two-component response regulator
MADRFKVVIADDEFISLMLFKRLVEECGHTVVAEAHSTKETLDAVREFAPDLVILDIAMEKRESGIIACKEINDINPGTSVVFVSGYGSETFREELSEVTYAGYLEKPVKSQHLCAVLSKIES